MSVTLFRAADGPGAPPGAHFSTSVDDASAYLDNPGFGGDKLWRFCASVSDALDTRVSAGTVDDIQVVAEKVIEAGFDFSIPGWDSEEEGFEPGAHELARDWADAGYRFVFHVLEGIPGVVASLIAAGHDWIVFYDDYPEGAETWRYLHGPEMAAAEQVGAAE